MCVTSIWIAVEPILSKFKHFPLGLLDDFWAVTPEKVIHILGKLIEQIHWHAHQLEKYANGEGPGEISDKVAFTFVG